MKTVASSGCGVVREAALLQRQCLFVAIGFLAFLAGPASAAEATHPLKELPLRRSVSQYGITWTFDKPVPVGQFVNGDFYVVGPVVVKSITPKPLVGTAVPASELGDREKREVKPANYVRSGSMLNPPALQKVAFDSACRNFFDVTLLAKLPVSLKAGDSLASSISLKVGEKSEFPYHGDGGYREHHDDSPVKTVAILTCVAEPQAHDAFRPAYADRTQKIYRASQLRRELLLRLDPPADVPNFELWERVFQRPWFNPGFFGWEQPMENMPRYGQWVGQAQSMAGLMLMLDVAPQKKEKLLIGIVQVGIDYWGLVRNGHPGWQGFGGHNSGRKFPIVFAGLLLGDEQMAAPTKAFPKVDFGEDNQTMYGEGWTGAKALFAGHSGVTASGKIERPRWGPYEHLPPAQWTQGNYNSESYRRANTSSSWVGEALVLRLLKAESHWNHDAFFDYVDRWMTEDDREHRAEIMKHWPEGKLTEADRWAHQGNTWEPFVKAMWEKYRHAKTSAVEYVPAAPAVK